MNSRAFWIPVLALGLLLATPGGAAGGDDSMGAKQILEKVDAAIKAVDTVRYGVSNHATGEIAARFKPMKGTVLMSGWTAGGIPARFHMNLQTEDAEGRPVGLTAGGDGESFFIIDHGTKKAYEDMDPGVLGSHARTLRNFGMIEFVHEAPFDDELNAESVELLGTETVDGEECHKLRVVYGQQGAESIWYFSKSDLLPRRRTRVLSGPQGQGTLDIVLSDLEIAPSFEKSLFRLKLPEGYEQLDDFAP